MNIFDIDKKTALPLAVSIANLCADSEVRQEDCMHALMRCAVAIAERMQEEGQNGYGLLDEALALAESNG